MTKDSFRVNNYTFIESLISIFASRSDNSISRYIISSSSIVKYIFLSYRRIIDIRVLFLFFLYLALSCDIYIFKYNRFA